MPPQSDPQAKELSSLRSQLLQTQKMEVVGNMASAFAHDFNNVLTVILFSVEQALIDLDEGVSVRGSIAHIRNEAQRAALLVRRLNQFAKPKESAQRVWELNDLVREYGQSISRVVRSDVNIDWSLSAEAKFVKVDSVGMEMVLLNLVLNAGHAMPNGGRLEIAVFERDGRACLSVRDSGTGMTPEVAAKAFDPFFTTKGDKGTGMGLAMVKTFISEQAGTVELDTAPGKGTTVTITLPLVAGTTRPAPEPEQTRFHGTEVVLVVDDDHMVRKAISVTLTRFGYKVLQASDGADALHTLALADGAVSVLVSDVVMPFAGGRKLTVEARAWFPDLKIILMSGHHDLQSVTVADAFMNKPFPPKDLAVRIRALLDGA